MANIGKISIVLLIIITIILMSIWIWYVMAKQPKSINNGTNPIITHTGIGKRGDMGNQMFQIACLYSLSKKYNAKLYIPELVKDLPIYSLFQIGQLNYKDVIPEREIYEFENYEDIILPQDGKIYGIRGYRQCFKYFDQLSDDIRKLFTPNKTILSKIKDIMPEKYIAVHIRKGDYLKNMHNFSLLKEFKRCSDEYYIKSLKEMKNNMGINEVYICTDSPNLVTDILEKTGAKLSPSLDKINPKFTDFCIMYMASSLIISNSTYSWWAAYLRKGRYIIAPDPWWDPDGFIGGALGLSGHYLHYPEWELRDPDNGNVKFLPGEIPPTDSEVYVPYLFKAIRGLVI